MDIKHHGVSLEQALQLITGKETLDPTEASKHFGLVFQIDTDAEAHLYSLTEALKRLDVQRTVITRIKPAERLVDDNIGWILVSPEIVRNENVDDKQLFDVTVTSCCVVTVNARDADDARDKVQNDPHVKGVAWRGLRCNGLEVTDVQPAE